MAKGKVEQLTSNIFVVDPNPPGSELISHEDLSLYVNFSAIPRNRSILSRVIGDDSNNTQTVTNELAPENGISFITSQKQGDENYLTTDYTSIGGDYTSSRRNRTSEGFGIKSIKISHNTSFVPKVSIEFIDVRGAALFDGHEYTNSNNEQVNKSIFSIWFKLPYPLFRLIVKGYYGRAVTYCLHMTSWKARFDSTTGHFVITAEFIGFTFAFLTDIILGYVMGVCERDDARDRLRKILGTNQEPLTISDLLSSFIKSLNAEDEFKENNKKVKALKTLKSVIKASKELQNYVGQAISTKTNNAGAVVGDSASPTTFTTDLNVIIAGNEKFDTNEVYYIRDVVLLLNEQPTIEKYKKFKKSFNDSGGLKEAFNKKIDDAVKDDLLKKLSNFKINQEVIPELGTDAYNVTNDRDALEAAIFTKLSEANDVGISYIGLQEALDNIIQGKEYKVISLYDVRKRVTDINVELSFGTKSKTGVAVETLFDELKKSAEAELRQFVGPVANLSIYEVFKVISANIQAFLETLASVARVAEDKGNERLKILKQKGFNLDNTDISDVGENGNLIYPFPSVYGIDVGDIQKNRRSTKDTEMWLGDVLGTEDNDNFPEIKLINDVIKNLTEKTDDLKVLKDGLSKTNTPSISNTDWFPVNPLDYGDDGLGDPYPPAITNIPKSLSEEIVSRYLVASNYTSYTTKQLKTIAKLEGTALFLRQTNQNIRDAITTNTNFVTNVINASSGVLSSDEIILGDRAINFNYDDTNQIFAYLDNDVDQTNQKIASAILSNEFTPDGTHLDKIKNLDRVLVPNRENDLVSKISRINKDTHFYEKDLTYDVWKTKDDKAGAQEFRVGENIKFLYSRVGDLANINDTNPDVKNVLKHITIITQTNLPEFTDKNEFITMYDGEFYDNRTVEIKNKSAFNVTRRHTFKQSPYVTDLDHPNVSELLVAGDDRKYIGIYNDKTTLIAKETSSSTPTTVEPSKQAQNRALDYLSSFPFRGFDKVISGAKTIKDQSSVLILPKFYLYWLGGLLTVTTQLGSTTPNTRYGVRSNAGTANGILPKELTELPQQVKDLLRSNFETWVEDEFKTDDIITDNFLIDIKSAKEPDGQDVKIEDLLLRYRYEAFDGSFNTKEPYDLNKTELEETKFKETQSKLNEKLTETAKLIILTPEVFKKEQENITKHDVGNLRKYLETLKTQFDSLNKKKKKDDSEKKKSEKTTTKSADSDLKLNVYKNFKNVYDKWLGGVRDGKVFNFCGPSIADTNRSDNNLIDYFHFVDRCWVDIGDKAFLNPKSFLTISNNLTMNMYGFFGRVLRDSNFDFHVLPNYVSFKTPKDVEDMFEPKLTLGDLNSGPTFLCMYVNTASRMLDVGDKYYSNDGFDLRRDDISNLPAWAIDRTKPKYRKTLPQNDGIHNMVAFRVAFGDQNQSIFNDISVGQEEHRETAESLQMISDLADRVGNNQKAYKGVNLFNVYATRSYTSSVTAMGNMLIQPLMYFQLDNIPMFHGAYVITSVEHNIENNSMTTNFTGVRQSKFSVPIVDSYTTFFSLSDDELSSLDRETPTITQVELGNKTDGRDTPGAVKGQPLTGKFNTIPPDAVFITDL